MSLRVHRIAFSTNVERVALALAYKGVERHLGGGRPGRPLAAASR